GATAHVGQAPVLHQSLNAVIQDGGMAVDHLKAGLIQGIVIHAGDVNDVPAEGIEAEADTADKFIRVGGGKHRRIAAVTLRGSVDSIIEVHADFSAVMLSEAPASGVVIGKCNVDGGLRCLGKFDRQVPQALAT